MRYNKEDKSGIALERFYHIESECDYIVNVNGDCIDSCSDPQKLAKRLELMSKRLGQIAKFLKKKKK